MSKLQSKDAQRRILLAEDTASLRELVVLNLRAEGYHVVEVDNGRDALDTLRGSGLTWRCWT